MLNDILKYYPYILQTNKIKILRQPFKDISVNCQKLLQQSSSSCLSNILAALFNLLTLVLCPTSLIMYTTPFYICMYVCHRKSTRILEHLFRAKFCQQYFVNNELQMQLNLTDVLVFISKVLLLCAISCVVSYFQSFRLKIALNNPV